MIHEVQKQYRRGDASVHVLSTVGMNIIVADHKLNVGTRYVDPPNCGSSQTSIGEITGSACLGGAILPVAERGMYAVVVYDYFPKVGSPLVDDCPAYQVRRCDPPRDSDSARNFDNALRETLPPNAYLVGTITVTAAPATLTAPKIPSR